MRRTILYNEINLANNSQFLMVYEHLKELNDNGDLFEYNNKEYIQCDNSTINSIINKENVNNIFCLENIVNGESMKYINALYEPNDLMCVIMNKSSGDLIALIYFESESYKCIFTQNHTRYTTISDYIRLYPETFFSDEIEINNVVVNHFLIDPKPLYIKLFSYLYKNIELDESYSLTKLRKMYDENIHMSIEYTIL